MHIMNTCWEIILKIELYISRIGFPALTTGCNNDFSRPIYFKLVTEIDLIIKLYEI
jgi:hypothetical protein